MASWTHKRVAVLYGGRSTEREVSLKTGKGCAEALQSKGYDVSLIDLSLAIARREDFSAHRGVYVAVTGPNLETRAEYRFLRQIGADVVGMSTVPEVLAAVHGGMRVLGLSIVTDMCLPDALRPASIEAILAHAAEAEPKLRKIVMGVLAREAAAAAR